MTEIFRPPPLKNAKLERKFVAGDVVDFEMIYIEKKSV